MNTSICIPLARATGNSLILEENLPLSKTAIPKTPLQTAVPWGRKAKMVLRGSSSRQMLWNRHSWRKKWMSSPLLTTVKLWLG